MLATARASMKRMGFGARNMSMAEAGEVGHLGRETIEWVGTYRTHFKVKLVRLYRQHKWRSQRLEEECFGIYPDERCQKKW